jgi:hypothetical protein
LLHCNKHTFPFALFLATEAQHSDARRNAKTAGEQDQVLAADRFYPTSVRSLGRARSTYQKASLPAQCGAAAIMEGGWWKSPMMPVGYAENELVERGSQLQAA